MLAADLMDLLHAVPEADYKAWIHAEPALINLNRNGAVVRYFNRPKQRSNLAAPNLLFESV